MKKPLLLIILVFISCTYSQTHKILSSTESSIKIQFDFSNAYTLKDYKVNDRNYLKIEGPGLDFREPGQPWLPEYIINVGVPFNSTPNLKILNSGQSTRSNVLILPYPDEDPELKEFNPEKMEYEIYDRNEYFPDYVSELDKDFIFRYARIFPVKVSPFQYNPVSRELVLNNQVTIEIFYNENSVSQRNKISDSFTRDYLYNTVINPKEAQKWVSAELPQITLVDSTWYNPNKNYFKIYLNKKGVYRLTYDYLVNAGVPLGSGVNSEKLELFNNGEKIPIDINDGGDSFFGPGDYLQFVGFPPTPTLFASINIYNNNNVYWLSYENDSAPVNYNDVNGFPSFFENTYTHVPNTLHFEQDSLYERLGYAGNDQRDFWFWGKASSQNHTINSWFTHYFNGPPELNADSAVTIRVDMHGMTNNPYCNPEHKAIINLTDKVIGVHIWDGQTRSAYEGKFFVSKDSIIIGEDSIIFYPEGNYLNITAIGDTCAQGTDEIRINWLEIEYSRLNVVNNNNFSFKAPLQYSGINRFWLWQWTRDNMIIYIPSKGKKISNPEILNDEFKSVLFVDTTDQETEYFCVASDFFLLPDSIRQDQPSNMASNINGADYIIIAHKKFSPIAEELKTFREATFPDTTISNPRIIICYIDDIYDEFSYGLLDPFAVQKFLKYAFDNWQQPAPFYVCLLGDMSYDYRHLASTSRENYIPSIPYYTHQYGLAASDNMFAAVSGNDVVPEMVISRFSIESIEEGNIFLDKVKNYPADYSKKWKQNVLLLSSGLDADDENYFGFNNASVELEDLYLRPNGIKTTKIMRFPNQPQYFQYQGGGPEIRKAISDGTVFVNYYGHGGGYQWDLTFLNDDIYLLENGNRLPFISSVTCYTAHFDNQDVFGEQFIKVPGKGAIAFFGSSGLTLWGIGTYINKLLFEEVFTRKEYITGKAILNAKSLVGGSSFYNSQIALLTLLGEPLLKLCIPDKPDFTVTTADISLSPENPIADDTVMVKINLYNIGVIFPNDSVRVELTASSSDTSFVILDTKRGSFGESDSIFIPWIPEYGGLYTLKLSVNLSDQIPEMDYLDNTIEVSTVIYDLTEPNIVAPIDGLYSNSEVNFLFSDIGHYIDLNLQYFIEIDTSINFENPIIVNQVIPEEGQLKWKSPPLPNDRYFWRTRIYDGVNYGGWSKIRTFTVTDSLKNGYNAWGRHLKLFNTYNVNYSPDGSLILNTNLLPPKPNYKTFLRELELDLVQLDSIDFTTITTDGKYIYLANIQYWSIDTVNTEGNTYIYKIGTGYNGTVEGQFYGKVPNFYEPISNDMFYHSDGYIYTAKGDPYKLKRVNPENGDTSTINIPQGLINWETSKVEEGAQYLKSDGTYIYNLAIYDSTGKNKYTLRILDPSTGWNLLRPDIELAGSSYSPGFSGFFVAKGYIYPSERYYGGLMRRIRAEDGFFEEEWLITFPTKYNYSWVYDWINDMVYSTTLSYSGYMAKVYKYKGTYIDAQGTISSSLIGPASKWKSVSYDIENLTSNGTFNVRLLGFNKQTRLYDSLFTGLSAYQDLDSIDAEKYSALKLDILFIDSSLTISSPLKLNGIAVDYETLPEVIFTKQNFTITPDTTLQGFDITLDFNAKNIGKIRADNLRLEFFMDDEDSVFYTQNIGLDPDSTVPIQTQIISTVPLSPATLHKIKAVGVLDKSEYFTFNNILKKGFYVARDSVQPQLNITIDGKEIINGDVVSSKPDILITLKDESPLPLDTSLFTVVYNNIPLNFSREDLRFESSPWPENEFRIRWNPELPDGRHVLEVLAKDPSGNFSDTIARRIVFYIVNSFDLVEVFNYPNPFSDETYFTFQLYGDNSKLEDFRIKVYSVAGRLIREFDIPPDQLRSGFNKLQWDGRDQDGDLLANGVYFYKIITRNNGEVKTKIQKLAKVK